MSGDRPGWPPWPAWPVAVVLLLGLAIAAYTAVFGVGMMRHHDRMARLGRPAEAVVVRVEERVTPARGGSTRQTLARVTFRTEEGRATEAVLDDFARGEAVSAGQRLAILYDPDDPATAQRAATVAEGPGIWPWCLIGFGVVMSAMVLSLLRRLWRRDPPFGMLGGPR